MQLILSKGKFVQTIARRFFAIAALLLASQALSGQDHWHSLFNGRDFAGWERLNGSAEYEVEEGGVIAGIFRKNSPNSFLATKEPYGDFILELEMKIPERVNSGIQIRSQSRPDYRNGRVHGYQVECSGVAGGYSGGIYDEARRGWLYFTINNRKARNALKVNEWNLYRIEAVGNRIRTWINGVGQWNRARIEVRDRQVTHYLNEVKIVEYERGSQRWKALVAFSKFAPWPQFGEHVQGHILLQDHGDRVSFKNIKIKEL